MVGVVYPALYEEGNISLCADYSGYVWQLMDDIAKLLPATPNLAEEAALALQLVELRRVWQETIML
ncbi:MAG: hypothetical protein ABIF10_06725 [Candidatus Woesearchaeota archaeon]